MVRLGCLLIALAIVSRASTSRVRPVDTSARVSPVDHCGETVPGAVERNCVSRVGGINTCGKKICKCPIYAQIQGDPSLHPSNPLAIRDDPACNPSLYDDGRKFNPAQLSGKGCKCVTPKWVETARKKPTFRCPEEETYFRESQSDLAWRKPDFLETAASWCDSNLVPENKRVPEALRGLYWMKGGSEGGSGEDVAFCMSLAEWDQSTLTATLSPWTDFVWRVSHAALGKTHQEKPPHDLSKVKGLVYRLTFTDETYTETTHMTKKKGYDSVNLPFFEQSKTGDGKIVSEKTGDVFLRPGTKAEGFNPEIVKYFAVRIMDDGGVVRPEDSQQPEWYKLMEMLEHRVKTSFRRYAQDCEDSVKTMLKLAQRMK